MNMNEMDDTHKIAHLVFCSLVVESATCNLVCKDPSLYEVSVSAFGTTATGQAPSLEVAFAVAERDLCTFLRRKKLPKSTPIDDVANPGLWYRFRHWLGI